MCISRTTTIGKLLIQRNVKRFDDWKLPKILLGNSTAISVMSRVAGGGGGHVDVIIVETK